ncbi:hypothetical protein [Candidatus Poriferisodalis sp.]|uniref:hypothetical protein n=1 Tax=Candidatus Poriferisodalis sp. TaxID=3101277 RepID=UPI003B022C82
MNLWILPGLGREVRFLDVGFRFEVLGGVEAPGGVVEFLDLAIPGSGLRKPADLSQWITSESGSLIFGMPIVRGPMDQISPVQTIVPDHVSATLVELSEFEPMMTEDLKAGVSLWRCHLAEPWNSAAGIGYCRIRFFVLDPGRMWTRPGVSPVDGRSFFDIRVLDVREYATSPVAPRIRKFGTAVLETVNTHLILPEEFEVLDAAENHKYVRLLETAAWRAYLGRRANLPIRRPKMLAVSWETQGSGGRPAADLTRPARFACMLRKHSVTLALARLLVAVIVAGLMVWFFVGSDAFRGGTANDVIGWWNEEVRAEDSSLPVADGISEDLLDFLLPVTAVGTLAGVVALVRWSNARQLVGRMKLIGRIRSGVEAWLVNADDHGRY